jgi:hypothetical protein
MAAWFCTAAGTCAGTIAGTARRAAVCGCAAAPLSGVFRTHGRTRGIDTSSRARASIIAPVTMIRTYRDVRTMDSQATLPANRAAHKYMSRTLVLCEWPMASRRWCRCFLSAENGDVPALVRRTTAISRSAYGISKIAAGSSSGTIAPNRFTVPA